MITFEIERNPFFIIVSSYRTVCRIVLSLLYTVIKLIVRILLLSVAKLLVRLSAGGKVLGLGLVNK